MGHLLCFGCSCRLKLYTYKIKDMGVSKKNIWFQSALIPQLFMRNNQNILLERGDS